jgi:hypothetical protein
VQSLIATILGYVKKMVIVKDSCYTTLLLVGFAVNVAAAGRTGEPALPRTSNGLQEGSATSRVARGSEA